METELLRISNKKVTLQIPFEDIVLVQSNGKSVVTHTREGESHCCCKNLGEMLKVLGKSKLFFRVHTSYIINLKQIKMYVKEKGGRIVMMNGSEIPISKRRKSGFLKIYVN